MDIITDKSELMESPSKVLHYVRNAEPTYPESSYMSSTPPLPCVPEETALSALVNDQLVNVGAECHCLDLSAFSVYRLHDAKKYAGELVALHELRATRGEEEFQFDGIISAPNSQIQHYVQGVKFSVVSVDGYGHDSHVVNIYLQTRLAAHQNVWYQLREPSPKYRRFYKEYLWIANFAKHFVDYLDFNVTFYSFRADFYQWMLQHHGEDPEFQKWLAVYNRQDFCTPVVANVLYLWKECNSVNDRAAEYPLWGEINPEYLKAIPIQLQREEKTVVTPFVYDAFKDSYFGTVLSPQVPKYPLRQFEFPAISPPGQSVHGIAKSDGRVQVGDVVGIKRDEDSIWKDSDSIWYAYVQGIHDTPDTRRQLEVIWVYSPVHTTLRKSKYPHQNELFLSDHCNCTEPTKLYEEEATRYAVTWCPKETPASGLFIRQKYCSNEGSFVSLSHSDLRCNCTVGRSKKTNPGIKTSDVMAKYRIGDTVLVLVRNTDDDESLSEPVEIRRFLEPQNRIEVRRLLRAGRDCYQSTAAPNELVHTDHLFEVSPGAVTTRCHVRFYSSEDIRQNRIPIPYSKRGTGNYFYITQQKAVDGQLIPISISNTTLNPGFDPTASTGVQKLRGLDLFCGSGNLGRGIAEGGAVEHLCAVDYDSTAIHSYRANVQRPERIKYFCGSVDDYLAQAIDAQESLYLVKVGEIDIIIAGSPCQGFSTLQSNKASPRSLLNASKIASVAAFVDLYKPKYVIMENVIGMAQKSHQIRDEQDVLSQLIAVYVAMGYQVQLFNLDAWSFGDPQQRSRIILVATAPGLAPLQHPTISHSHYPGLKKRHLGKTASGEPFGRRQMDINPPFRFVSARTATEDLPYIGNGRVRACAPFPDHRVSRGHKLHDRALMSMIPISPPGSDFMKALALGKIDQAQINAYPLSNKIKGGLYSKSWGRINGDGLFPTIVTKVDPADGVTGRVLHWQEHRPITVMEARRAQGIPDDEVIIGAPSQQIRIIGNSVPRSLAIAVGLSLREAWLSNCNDGREPILVEQKENLQVRRPSEERRIFKGVMIVPLEKQQIASFSGDRGLAFPDSEGDSDGQDVTTLYSHRSVRTGIKDSFKCDATNQELSDSAETTKARNSSHKKRKRSPMLTRVPSDKQVQLAFSALDAIPGWTAQVAVKQDLGTSTSVEESQGEDQLVSSKEAVDRLQEFTAAHNIDRVSVESTSTRLVVEASANSAGSSTSNWVARLRSPGNSSVRYNHISSQPPLQDQVKPLRNNGKITLAMDDSSTVLISDSEDDKSMIRVEKYPPIRRPRDSKEVSGDNKRASARLRKKTASSTFADDPERERPHAPSQSLGVGRSRTARRPLPTPTITASSSVTAAEMNPRVPLQDPYPVSARNKKDRLSKPSTKSKEPRPKPATDTLIISSDDEIAGPVNRTIDTPTTLLPVRKRVRASSSSILFSSPRSTRTNRSSDLIEPLDWSRPLEKLPPEKMRKFAPGPEDDFF